MSIAVSRTVLMRRFWSTAAGYWRTPGTRIQAWSLTACLALVVLSQIWVQYRLNYWTRDVFDAVAAHSAAQLWHQAAALVPLTLLTVALAVAAVYGRMSMQRQWRAWLVTALIDRWVREGRYFQLNLQQGDAQVPEGRITDDARFATDAPVDFAVGLFQSLVTALTFIGILWVVGGDLAVSTGAIHWRLHGYLVISVIGYSVLITLLMRYVARRFTVVSEQVSQAEAEFRFGLTHIREHGESIALLGSEAAERSGVHSRLQSVVHIWKRYCSQHMRATVVSTANGLIAPAIPIFLCMPKFLDGALSLGEVTQLAAAFVQAQGAFGWLVDNYPRFADWMASARRVGFLLESVDRIEADQDDATRSRIRRTTTPVAAMRLRGLAIDHNGGSVVLSDQDIVVERNERVLLLGDSGTGKDVLVQTLAGLWHWGSGELAMRQDLRMALLTQQPYLPLGTLRAAISYPRAAEDRDDPRLYKLLQAAGIPHLQARLDHQAPWDQVLSSSERQRLGFVRAVLGDPNVVILDEAISALDPQAQAQMMGLLADNLKEVAVISVSHHPELRGLHDRVLRYEFHPAAPLTSTPTALPR